MEQYCVDTHALIWYVTSHPALSAKARLILREGLAGQHMLTIPTIVFLELYHKNLKSPLVDTKNLHKALNKPTVQVAPFDQRVLLMCYRLPRDLNIHDRVIAATAMVTGSTLVTKDERLRKLTVMKTVW